MLKPRKARSLVWSNPLVALLAASGSVAGALVPGHLTGTMMFQGGSVFLLCYLVMQLFVGVPLMMAWLYLGRQSVSSAPAGVVIEAVRTSKLSRFWGWLEPLWLLWTLLFAALLTTVAVAAAKPLFTVAAGEVSSTGIAIGIVVALVWLMGVFKGAWLGRLLATGVGVLVILSIWQLWLGNATASWSTWQEVFGWRVDQFTFAGFLLALQLVLVVSSLGGAMLWVIGRYLSEQPVSLGIWALSILIGATLLMLIMGVGASLGESPLSFDILTVISVLLAVSMMSEALVAPFDKKQVVRPLGLFIVVLGVGVVAAAYLFWPALDWFKAFTFRWLLGIAVIAVALLVGWMLKETKVRKTMAVKNFSCYLVSRALLRLLVPLSAGVLLLRGAGLW